MKPLILIALAALASHASAQQQAFPQTLERAPNAERIGPLDPAATPMLADPDNANDFRRWYLRNKRPAVVVYVARQLDQLKGGWRGEDRLLIEEVSRSGSRTGARSLTVGTQHNSAADTAPKTSLDKLFEQAIGNALKRQDVRVLDGTFLHRKLAASNRDDKTDLEFASLSRSARFVLEVETLCVEAECELVATLKDLHSGEVAASARQQTGAIASPGDIDRISKALVERLMRYRVG